ncbi:YciI family protein [Planobispora takensis]|uniref:Transcription initiation protein n=1 Tax=Planobispora takensis TaxID=1367882 RepID=A0A8J3SRY5_9ACTN|nr:YciI family protein [Planobispora takensis]GIH98460.1 transcription initiation protein [Planobispora takensis]
MPLYIALTYTTEVDWTRPEYAEGLREYTAFEQAHAAVLRGGHALYPTATATTLRVPGGGGGDPIVSDGPYAETKEALTGYYLMECADLDEALAVAAEIPAVRYGTIEVRPVHPSLDT